MTSERRVLALYDERMLFHAPDTTQAFQPGRLERRVKKMLASLDYKWDYPEHPGRITAVWQRLQEAAIRGVEFRAGSNATRAQLGRVHTNQYLDSIFELRGKTVWLDDDTTAISPKSVQAAGIAAGTAIDAVEAVVQGEADSAFAIVRPPGHHAEPARARGFCLFNNVAVAAAHAQAKLGCERVLIVDWDAHHGNGTQEIFWADDGVLLFDTHRASPFYPGSGLLHEVGAGLGAGYTINVPLPQGTSDQALVQAFNEILVPAANHFQPDLVLVSAGFDPHPLDQCMNISYTGFAHLTRIVQRIADQHCKGRLALVLEGGYALESLARGACATIETLAGTEPPPLTYCGMREVEEALAFHRSVFEDGA